MLGKTILFPPQKQHLLCLSYIQLFTTALYLEKPLATNDAEVTAGTDVSEGGFSGGVHEGELEESHYLRSSESEQGPSRT